MLTSRFFKGFLALMGLCVLSSAFQNCASEVGFQTIPSKVVVTEGEGCVPGDKLGVWLDPNHGGQIFDSQFLGYVVSYAGSESAYDNYNYYSYSAHPIHGPIPLDHRLNVFFYNQNGPNELALNVFSNIDTSGGSGSFSAQLSTLNNDLVDGIILQDDPYNDVGCLRTSGSLGSFNYDCSFNYKDNTDGFVMGPFVTRDFE